MGTMQASPPGYQRTCSKSALPCRLKANKKTWGVSVMMDDYCVSNTLPRLKIIKCKTSTNKDANGEVQRQYTCCVSDLKEGQLVSYCVS